MASDGGLLLVAARRRPPDRSPARERRRVPARRDARARAVAGRRPVSSARRQVADDADPDARAALRLARAPPHRERPPDEAAHRHAGARQVLEPRLVAPRRRRRSEPTVGRVCRPGHAPAADLHVRALPVALPTLVVDRHLDFLVEVRLERRHGTPRAATPAPALAPLRLPAARRRRRCAAGRCVIDREVSSESSIIMERRSIS
mmetsp:Transcript_17507/g.70318  ORF Transcript_17507/g.70318 Transcript_17507/m.70318 type:complete len:204 (+) Transcript_17507:1566-2177(+)